MAEPILVDRERLSLAITYHAHQGGCCDGVRPGTSLSEHAIDVALPEGTCVVDQRAITTAVRAHLLGSHRDDQ